MRVGLKEARGSDRYAESGIEAGAGKFNLMD
jgi:hypothetical protein